ncbi:MAG: sigma-54 dependent transcriptional regulator [Dissulfurispiraceae bacterium]|jgi:DNA-binding NtrC family response regulator|nr:sigma-54 dependent transcriptional regulator [Dissulfurispiraceae bacterium]
MNKQDFRIMVVDDDRSFLALITKILVNEGYAVKGIGDPVDAIDVAKQFYPHLVITDLKMPQMDGVELMHKLREDAPFCSFVLITAYATVDTAVAAMKSGASDYITKPLKSPDELRTLAQKFYDIEKMNSEKEVLPEDMPPMDVLFAGMEGIMQTAKEVSSLDTTVMLYGETGSGKSLIANAMHILSSRPGLFVDINCAVIPENLLESELFGYEKGAFTGAVTAKKGKFELAGDGTIFLDEVSEMSPSLQAKFLKVLQDKKFERLGSLNTIKTDARIIAATNRNLKTLVEEKKFREDLYYRLNVFPLTIAPLRNRRDSIETIAGYLLKKISARLGKQVNSISDDLMQKMKSYSWPGNVRELQNVIERGIIVSKSSSLVLSDSISWFDSAPSATYVSDAGMDIKSAEKAAIENALARTSGSRKEAAVILGISLRALQYKIKEYGIK